LVKEYKMKDYLAKPKSKTPFSQAKLEAYLNAGNVIESCSHGETGGDTLMYKEMMKKQINSAKNKRKIA